MREEANIEAEIKDVTHGTNEALINVSGVGDDLERIERDTYWEDDSVNTPEWASDDVIAQASSNIGHLEIGAKDLVDDIGKKITVLEVAEDTEVNGNGETKQEKRHLALLVPFVDSLLSEAVDAPGKEKVCECDENQKTDKET